MKGSSVNMLFTSKVRQRSAKLSNTQQSDMSKIMEERLKKSTDMIRDYLYCLSDISVAAVMKFNPESKNSTIIVREDDAISFESPPKMSDLFRLSMSCIKTRSGDRFNVQVFIGLHLKEYSHLSKRMVEMVLKRAIASASILYAGGMEALACNAVMYFEQIVYDEHEPENPNFDLIRFQQGLKKAYKVPLQNGGCLSVVRIINYNEDEDSLNLDCFVRSADGKRYRWTFKKADASEHLHELYDSLTDAIYDPPMLPSMK
jgi:hypothetical protein